MEADFVAGCVEEVALEGLDGITLSSLWLRLQDRPGFSLAIDDQSKRFIWRVLQEQQCLEMFVLPKPRATITISRREKYIDPESGICVEPESLPDEVYPLKLINKNGVMGSCATFDVRENLTERLRNTEISLDHVIKEWGDRLVIVASQGERTRTLMGMVGKPSITLQELTYCLLERIARSRHEGLLMVGKELDVFSEFNLKPKEFFYQRKILARNGLLKKQLVVIRNVKNLMKRVTLAHLPRFFRIWETRFSFVVSKICQMLRELPNHTCERRIIVEQLGLEKYLFKRLMPAAAPYLRLGKMPYSQLYPESPIQDRFYEQGSERILHVVTMVRKYPPEEEASEEEEEDDEEGEEFVNEQASGKTDKHTDDFHYKIENLCNERLFMHKLYSRLEKAGPEGMTQREVQAVFNMNRLEVRAALRRLLKIGLLAEPVMRGEGRQKTGVYMTRGHAKDNKIHQEFVKEKKKYEELNQSSPEKTHTVPETPPTAQKPQKSTKKKSEAPPPEDVIDRSSQDNSVAKKESSKYADGWCKLDMLNLRRMNQIVEAVREAKLLDNVFALQKMITQKEADDVNVQGRIDRRSLLRLINTLAREGKIKSIKTAISSGLHTKNLHFVCDPSIAPSDPIVQSAIDHARFKYFTVAKETCQSLKKDATGVNSSEAQPPPTNMSSYPETIRQSFQKLKEFRSAVKMKDMVYDPTCSRKYGLVPKMSRLRHVHQLLWYHVYGYQGTVPEDLQAFQETTYLGLPRSELPPEETCKGKRTRKKCLPVISPETTEKKSEQCSETVSDVNYCVASTSEAQGKSSIPEEKDVEVKKTVEEDENKMSTKDTDSGLSASKEPVVYLDEMSWKRYLPPLPKHKGYGEGWCLVSDVLLSLPLSIFCHIINIPYRVPGLLELLAHPHKQFYPIITVPRKVSQQLTYARKYMFTFHSILVQLAHLGLLSIGQQQFKDKAQVFVYIHKNATLVDTRSSKVGYMLTRVPGDDPFPRRQYHLDTWNDVECFWSELMDICLSTRLGRYVDFQSTHSSMITGHMSLVEAIAPCTPDTVRDDGIIPGDGMGAAGLDSSLFCHLYRNWVKKKRAEPVTQDADDAFMIRATKLSAIRSMEEKEARKESKGENSVLEFSAKAAHTRLPRLLPYPKLTLDGEATKENRAEVVRGRFVRGARGNRGGRGVKRTGAHQSDRSHSIPKKIRASVAGGVRKKYHKKRTLLMDARDVTAHKLMEKKRVVWTTAEDSLLLLCKVANLYLGGMRNKTVCLVPWTTIRDILHQSLPVSKDKTSSACRRRVPFMMKNPQTVLNVETFLAEAQHDKSITSEFRYQRYKQSTPGAGEAFLKLFNRLREKFISGKFHERGFLPATVSDLRKKYKVSTVGYFKPKRTFCEARTIPEIHQAVIRDTLQSYMSLSDKKGRAHEVYMLFNHYSDAILSQVFGALREDQVITRLKKSPPQSTKRMKQVSDVHDHHLSQSYFNKLHQPMPASVFNECWAMISDLHCHSNDPGWKIELDIKLTKGGTVATIINLLAVRKIKVELEIPEQILVLDDKAKHTVSAKKVRTNLEFLEQKKTNREEDEDIELFEKSQKITSTAMAGAGLFNKAIVSSSPDDVRVESGDIHAELGPDHLVEIVWAGTETETTATPEKAAMMTDIPILRPAETTTTTKTASSPEPSTSSETRVSPSKSPRQAKEDSQPDERLATVESRHGTYKVPHGFASRSTLSMLRNRYIDSQHTVAKLNPQDFFLVKSCNIKASMVERNKDEADENLCSVILSEEVMSWVIKSLLRVQPQKVEEAVEWEKMMNVLNTDDVSAARQFYTAVKDAGHFGITETEIKEKMKQNPVDTDTFQKLSVCLQDHHMVLRVGVATHRYVSHAHASHWLLHGYKNTRGRSKPTVTYEPDTSGDVCESTSSQQQEESEGQRDATLTSESNEASQELSSIDETGEASTLARMAKKRKLMEDDITQGLYKSTYERVLFVPRPWRTPEGWLNRGVFTDLTKALTTFLLLNPGSDQQTVIERFNPALQPVATIELIEVLQEIGAVESTFLRKCKKPTLFSTPLICTELARGDPVPAEDCLIVYEARMECISHVGQLCDYVVQQPKIQVSN